MSEFDVRTMLENAIAHYNSGRVQEVVRLSNQILKISPKNPDALNLLGITAYQMGQLDIATGLLQQAVRNAPDRPSFLNNLGNVLMAKNRIDEALETYYRVLEINPQLAEVRHNIGCLLQEQGKLKRAIEFYQSAIDINPEYVEAYTNLGSLLQEQGEYHDAIEIYNRALEINPNIPEIHNNIGIILQIQGIVNQSSRYIKEAVARHQHALTINSQYPAGESNLGLALQKQGNMEGAISCYKRALKIDPKFQNAHYNLSFVELQRGNFKDGWYHHTARYGRDADTIVPFCESGIDLENKRILISKEQGLGEELFFLRFMPRLKSFGVWLAYQTDARLVSMISTLPFIDFVTDDATSLNDIDFIFMLGDLPRLLDVDDVEQIPPPISVQISSEDLASVQERLSEIGPSPYVGIAWWAGVKNDMISYRKVDFRCLAKLFRDIECTVLILQRDVVAEEITAFSEILGRRVHNFSDYNQDLDKMAALLKLIDHHVTVSNTNVHLRAAVGKSSSVLIPMYTVARIWIDQEKSSSWYPGTVIYRQNEKLGWDHSFGRLKKDLQLIPI